MNVCVSVCVVLLSEKSLDSPSSHPSFQEGDCTMALTCHTCGYCSNEVKSGAGVSEKGTRMRLHLTDASHLSRDILKVRSHAVIPV